MIHFIKDGVYYININGKIHKISKEEIENLSKMYKQYKKN